eukprot:GHUV01033299.1.p1 GENE.GHUV01033299.1~~GHUV01033299.1.p1  ORF type:complete len:181 (+),score=16.35 GHUV01033299.1:609-1151(+)
MSEKGPQAAGQGAGRAKRCDLDDALVLLSAMHVIANLCQVQARHLKLQLACRSATALGKCVRRCHVLLCWPASHNCMAAAGCYVAVMIECCCIQLLTEVMNLKAIITLALFLVTIRIYRSLCLRYMKVQDPSVRTGVCKLEDSPLLFNICVRKFSAMSLLQDEHHVQLCCLVLLQLNPLQ